MRKRCIPYGYKMEKGNILENSEESEIVRMCFKMYLEGCSFQKLAEHLTGNRIEYLKGKFDWNKNRVKRMIQDERYIGKKEGYAAILDFSIFKQAQLHWIIADKNEAITLEAVREGLRIYENPAGVLTNNPPFDEQMFALNNYMHLSPKEPQNHFSSALPLRPYSRGMGALGLPGDLSSQSRFVRVAFTKMNAVSGDAELESVSQFFHILGAVEQQRGCCEVENGAFEITLYTSCCNADQGIYYYTTYDNHQITAVDMREENLDGEKLVRYPLVMQEQIRWQNRK